MDGGLWIDFQNPRLRHIDFELPYGFPGRKDLPVYIGQAYPVIVDKIKRADPASCQCLYGVPADATNAEYGDPRLKQLVQSPGAKLKLCSGKLI